MIGIAFLAIIIIGIYLLLRFNYEELSFGRFLSYTVMSLCAGAAILTLAATFGRELPRLQRLQPLIHNNDTVQIIELNADDLDPQIQDALIEAVRNRTRPHLSADDILKELQPTETGQEGVCGVCYEVLDENLLCCPECHKAAHKPCLKQWIESGHNVCIYCRHNLIPA